MTVPTPSSKASQSTENQITALMTMQATQGWAIVVRILNENVKYLETLILDRYDPISKKELTDEEIDKMRYKRNITKELLDLPQNYIKTLSETDGEEPVEYDPYFKNTDEINKADL